MAPFLPALQKFMATVSEVAMIKNFDNMSPDEVHDIQVKLFAEN
jgi:hypothetical protein